MPAWVYLVALESVWESKCRQMFCGQVSEPCPGEMIFRGREDLNSAGKNFQPLHLIIHLLGLVQLTKPAAVTLLGSLRASRKSHPGYSLPLICTRHEITRR
jgi:hypothetical protein